MQTLKMRTLAAILLIFRTTANAQCSFFAPQLMGSVCMSSDGDRLEPVSISTDAFQDSFQLTKMSGDTVGFRVRQNLNENPSTLAVRSGFDECIVEGGVQSGEYLDFEGDYCSGESEAEITVVIYNDPDLDPEDCEACNVDSLDDMSGGSGGFCAYNIEIPCKPKPQVIDSICMSSTGDELPESPLPSDTITITKADGVSMGFDVNQMWDDAVGVAVRTNTDECLVERGFEPGEQKSFEGDYCASKEAEATLIIYDDAKFDTEDCNACNAGTLMEMGGGGSGFCAYMVELPCEPVVCELPSTTAPSDSPSAAPSAAVSASPAAEASSSPTAALSATPTASASASPSASPAGCSAFSEPEVVSSFCKTSDGKIMEEPILFPESALVVTQMSDGDTESTLGFSVSQEWSEAPIGLAVNPDLGECFVTSDMASGSFESFQGDFCDTRHVASVNVVVYFDDSFDPDECEACNTDNTELSAMGDSAFCAYHVEIPCETIPVECPTPTESPSATPSAGASDEPSASPIAAPSGSPSASPIAAPSGSPSASPIAAPSGSPSASPIAAPSASPSASPIAALSATPTASASASPSASPAGCSAFSEPKVVSSFCKTSDGKIMEEPILFPESALVVTQMSDGDTESTLGFSVSQEWSEAPIGLAVNPDLGECFVTSDMASGSFESFQGDFCNSGDLANVNVVVYFDDSFDPDECEACNTDNTELSAMGDSAFCAYHVEIPCETIPVECPTPTESPTEFPTEIDDTYSCPSDITLLDTFGITEYPNENSRFPPVKVVSQDKTSVTVEMQQAWNAPVDKFFYECRETVFSNHCYEIDEIPGEMGNPIARTEIQCNVFKPVAFLKICLQDLSGTFLDNSLDDGKVPKCCYSDAPVGTPTVCYKLEILCESSCSEESSVETKEQLRRNLRHGKI